MTAAEDDQADPEAAPGATADPPQLSPAGRARAAPGGETDSATQAHAETVRDRLVARWAAWGTVASSIATVLALLVSAAATYWAWQVIEEEQQDKEQQQAAMVTMWVQQKVNNPPANEKGELIPVNIERKITVENRSPEAVTRVYILGKEWSTKQYAGFGENPELVEYDILYEIGMLPPCTMRRDAKFAYKEFEDFYLYFQDADERTWKRLSNGGLERAHRPEEDFDLPVTREAPVIVTHSDSDGVKPMSPDQCAPSYS